MMSIIITTTGNSANNTTGGASLRSSGNFTIGVDQRFNLLQGVFRQVWQGIKQGSQHETDPRHIVLVGFHSACVIPVVCIRRSS